MRWLFVALALLVLTTGTVQAAEYKLGFKALADQIPDIVGTPLEDEHHNPLNGDALQKTSKGLMVWRKSDNQTLFTNGDRSWVNGPMGLQDRPNENRFEWETDYPVFLMDKGIRPVINKAVEFNIQRIERYSVSEDMIVLEWSDTNWTEDILKRHQYEVVTALADWVVGNSDLRPSIALKGTSALGTDRYVQSVTSGELIDAIGKRQAGQSEWLGKARFTTKGELY